MTIDDHVAFGLQAYCDNAEQSRLLEDALKGFMAMGKLTGGMVPQVRELLDKIEIRNADNRIEVIVDIPIKDIQALQELAIDYNVQ